MYHLNSKNRKYRFKYSNEDAIWHLHMSSRKHKYYNFNKGSGKMLYLEFIPMNTKETVFKAIIPGPTRNHAAKVVGEFIPKTCVDAYIKNIASRVMM